MRSGGHSWVAWSLHDDALLIDLSGLREMAIAAPGVATVSPSIRGGSEFSPFIRSQGYLFPGGHCPTVGSGRLPAPGRPGMERPSVGVGLRERARGRRGDRRRRVGPRQRRFPPRPVLGGARRRSGVLRCRHALPPRVVRPSAGVRADRLRAADRPLRRRVALGARGAADARSTGRAGHRRHPHPSGRGRHRRRADDDHARHRPVRLAGRGRPPDAAAAGVPGARRRLHA